MHFEIPAVTSSQNPWDRMHWTQRSAQKEHWFWLIRATMGVQETSAKKRLLHIVRVSKRLIDDQNVPSGCKYLVDALVEFGHLYKDSRNWTRITFDQRKCGKDEQPHMEVTISEE